MKKLTNTTKVLRYVRSHPKAKAKEVSLATKVPVNSVYQIIHKSKKDQALTMSSSPAVLLKYPPKRGRPAKNQTNLTEVRDGQVRLVTALTSNKSLTVTVDNVNSPAHYKAGGIETIDFIEAKKLGYNLGNVVKYVSRADYKGRLVEDLKKAEWYLKREIANMEKAK
jgi:hypothetical protein